MARPAALRERHATLGDEAHILGPLRLKEAVAAVATLVELGAVQWEAHREGRQGLVVLGNAVARCEHVHRGDRVATPAVALLDDVCQPIVAVLVPPVQVLDVAVVPLVARPLDVRAQAQEGGHGSRRRRLHRRRAMRLGAAAANSGQAVELPRRLAPELRICGRRPTKLQEVQGVSNALLPLALDRMVEALGIRDPWRVEVLMLRRLRQVIGVARCGLVLRVDGGGRGRDVRCLLVVPRLRALIAGRRRVHLGNGVNCGCGVVGRLLCG
mmetsp:Transcript_72708/g.204148  ORF Transcript_72708/g.204148 Transcript_72708/m.204148 type:complete len:269 (-) Transcript_72708:800-1606(-)